MARNAAARTQARETLLEARQSLREYGEMLEGTDVAPEVRAFLEASVGFLADIDLPRRRAEYDRHAF